MSTTVQNSGDQKPVNDSNNSALKSPLSTKNQSKSSSAETETTPDRHPTRQQERKLLRAVRKGNITAVRTFLENGVSPDGRFEDITPIFQCIRHSRLEILQLLLTHNAKSPHRMTDGTFEDDLLLAAYKGNLDILKPLYEYRRKQGQGYVHCTPGYFDSAELIHATARNDHTKCIEFLLQQQGEDQLEWATRQLETPLHFAVNRPHARRAVVRYLLDRGADVNATTFSGRTAIYFAAERGNVGVIKELLRESPHLDQKTRVHEKTVLHEAAYHCPLEVVQMLVEAGADVYARDRDGLTLLEYARKARRTETVEWITRTFGLEALVDTPF